MSFDVAAEAYDRFMGRFSQPLAVEFAGWVPIAQGARVLDVGCGPGALLAALASRTPPDQLAGIDPSESFLTAARARFPWADLRHGSAEAIPFDDDDFDAALAQLVVHFMTDAAAGIAEMVRVTRPGGTIAASVWDFAGRRAPQSTFFEALASVAPGIDDETGRAGARRGHLVSLLEQAGCADVAEDELRVCVDYADFDEWWGPYTLGVAPAGRQLAALSPSDRERVRARCRELLPSGPFTIAATAWAARGVVPA
ncbi:class I SAM-dependent methyltransferase [Microbacterium sp. SSM24]|uniref:class I SAM-dependent methyltransferase n=1 Tax=Microbacterium sp. SSM24 TaxID=2991714 RepID=UPI0022273D0D|nr:class I SAM-dependent methyltransferase [Microbacterium sp. SSM24]MCW3493557.1 class I SAM-dependent methyltransferase [Microbacterium sp. SSM24]